MVFARRTNSTPCIARGTAQNPDTYFQARETSNNHYDAGMPRVSGGRYGLSSKEFTPAMAKAILDEIARPAPRPRFTVGINDDVTHLSLDVDPNFTLWHSRGRLCC